MIMMQEIITLIKNLNPRELREYNNLNIQDKFDYLKLYLKITKEDFISYTNSLLWINDIPDEEKEERRLQYGIAVSK